jgi:hypothetical protein
MRKPTFTPFSMALKYMRCALCPDEIFQIVFHPNKHIRDGGYTQNIEAKISCFQHENKFSTAEDLLHATNNGAHLGLTKEQTIKFVTDAKMKNKNAVFYLYKIEFPKKSQIEWIDSG